MTKSTEELLNALKAAKSVNDYLTTHENELLDFSLPKYLAQLLQEKSLDKSTVIKASGLNHIYGYQIFSGNRTPSRDKLLALAFGFSLDTADTQRLLKYAQQPPLYARSQRDSIVIFALDRHLGILLCNELLDEAGEPLLISAE